jgi:hypothetical protein
VVLLASDEYAAVSLLRRLVPAGRRLPPAQPGPQTLS